MKKIEWILLFVNCTSIKLIRKKKKKEAEQIIVIPACPDTPLPKSFVDCNHSYSAAASGPGLRPANMLPDAGTLVTMKRSYFNSCLEYLIYSLTLNKPLPPTMQYCILPVKN